VTGPDWSAIKKVTGAAFGAVRKVAVEWAAANPDWSVDVLMVDGPPRVEVDAFLKSERDGRRREAYERLGPPRFVLLVLADLSDEELDELTPLATAIARECRGLKIYVDRFRNGRRYRIYYFPERGGKEGRD
jgi:hypothetical protein